MSGVCCLVCRDTIKWTRFSLAYMTRHRCKSVCYAATKPIFSALEIHKVQVLVKLAVIFIFFWDDILGCRFWLIEGNSFLCLYPYYQLATGGNNNVSSAQYNTDCKTEVNPLKTYFHAFKISPELTILSLDSAAQFLLLDIYSIHLCTLAQLTSVSWLHHMCKTRSTTVWWKQWKQCCLSPNDGNAHIEGG